MSIGEQIQSCLSNANMTLYSNEHDFGWSSGRKVARDGGDPHRESCLICVFNGIGNFDLRTGLALTGTILCCCVNWYIEDGSGRDHLLGGKDAIGVRFSAF